MPAKSKTNPEKKHVEQLYCLIDDVATTRQTQVLDMDGNDTYVHPDRDYVLQCAQTCLEEMEDDDLFLATITPVAKLSLPRPPPKLVVTPI